METRINETSFIVIDGQDGSGKGTQVKLLKERLEREGKDVVFTREPGGVPLSEALRRVIKSPDGMSADSFTQFLMFWAARNEWVKKLIAPTVAKGTPVFSDRCDSSTYAYQVFAQNAPQLAVDFWRIREIVFGDAAPTMYLILDVPAEVARKRALGDGDHTSAFDVAPLEFYELVRKGFGIFAENVPSDVIIIDGTHTPEIIHEEIYALVKEQCGWK